MIGRTNLNGLNSANNHVGSEVLIIVHILRKGTVKVCVCVCVCVCV